MEVVSVRLAETYFANNEEFVTSVYCVIPTFKWSSYKSTELFISAG